MRGLDLTAADFCGADLRNASLVGARVDGASGLPPAAAAAGSGGAAAAADTAAAAAAANDASGSTAGPPSAHSSPPCSASSQRAAGVGETLARVNAGTRLPYEFDVHVAAGGSGAGVAGSPTAAAAGERGRVADARPMANELSPETRTDLARWH